MGFLMISPSSPLPSRPRKSILSINPTRRSRLKTSRLFSPPVKFYLLLLEEFQKLILAGSVAGNVGIGTTGPLGKLHVDHGSGTVATYDNTDGLILSSYSTSKSIGLASSGGSYGTGVGLKFRSHQLPALLYWWPGEIYH